MKISRFELQAFGPFSGTVLDFTSPIPGLHIVYGANEAGKSSAMRALYAWFFGFPLRSTDDFLHKKSNLLVSGTLENQHGEELIFSRRKRKERDLFDSNDNPLAPHLIDEWLQGVDLELFKALYSMSYETLSLGGQGILDEEGEIGKALFAAGAGLASLRPMLEKLQNEADDLFRPQGARQQLNEALTRYRTLQQQLRDATLSGSLWQEKQEALHHAEAERIALQTRKQALETEKHRLERLQHALPELADRNHLLEQLRALGSVPLLPADFSKQRIGVEQQLQLAQHHYESEQQHIQTLQQSIASHHVNKALLEYGALLDELYQRLGEYRKGKSDLPQRRSQRLAALQSALTILHPLWSDVANPSVLGTIPHTYHEESLREGNADEAISAVLTQRILHFVQNDKTIPVHGQALDSNATALTVPLLLQRLQSALLKKKEVQRLAAHYEAFVSSGKSARQQVQESEQALVQVQRELAELPQQFQSNQLEQALRIAERNAALDSDIAELEKRLRHSEHECNTMLQRITLWQGTLEQVPTLSLPLPETINRFDEAFQHHQSNKLTLQSQEENLQKRLEEIRGEVAQLTSERSVPSVEELQQSRARRNEGWELLKRQWLQQEKVTEESLEYHATLPLHEAYEEMVTTSDRLADRLYREVERVRRHTALLTETEKLQQQQQQLHQRREALMKDEVALHAAWQEQWRSIAIKPLSPREMVAWITSFEMLRQHVREHDKLLLEHNDRYQRRQEAIKQLHEAVTAVAPPFPLQQQELAPLLHYAQQQLSRLQAIEKRNETLHSRKKEISNSLESARQRLQQAEKELHVWRKEWQEATTSLALAGQLQPMEVVECVEAMQQAQTKLYEAEEFRKRIEGIERDMRQFETDVTTLTTTLALELHEGDVVKQVTLLHQQLDEARREQTLLQREQEELALHEAALHRYAATLEESRLQLLVMCKQAHCATPNELLIVEARSQKAVELQEKIAAVETRLVRIAGNSSVEALEDEAACVEHDALPSQIEALNDEIQYQLQPKIEHLHEEIGRFHNELQQMEQENGKAADFADAAQRELARIQRLSNRYIRLRLAEMMVRNAIERYRSSSERPVLSLASSYFATLTMNSFKALDTISDDNDHILLVGIRADGTPLAVEAMSSGTRDQLYLALRLATLQWRMQQSEPMPIIADDILITFDDERSKATLQALATLGEQCQIILFTHHRSVVEIASSNEFKGKIFLHSLSEPSLLVKSNTIKEEKEAPSTLHQKLDNLTLFE